MIIAIDPGITNCGINLSTKVKDKLKILKTINIAGSRKLREQDEIDAAETYGERTGKLLRIASAVKDLILENPQVNMIVLEAPFINMRRPLAFASLLEVLHTIKYTVALPNQLKICVVEPKLVKKVFAGNGNAGKDMMREAMEKHVSKGKVILKDFTIEDLSEHEVDAGAVAYTFYFDAPDVKKVTTKNKKKKRG